MRLIVRSTAIVMILLPGCSGDISADVFADGVLGEYTAYVSNESDMTHTVLCTVTASTGDTDDFSLTLAPGEAVRRTGKIPLRDFTDDLEIECSGATAT